jgi:adenosylcobinamide-GDP ribazoletransferase
MTLLRSFAMAFSCFSRIPMPHVEWKPESMRYMMCFFPFIGICIGLLAWLWCWLAGVLGFGKILVAAGIALIPIAITGGIHLDGFADCIDAQASHAEPTRKREILKDPHSGAFAVIGTVSYVLLYFAIATEFVPAWQAIVLLGCMHVISRASSSIATVAFPTATQDGMLASFHVSADKRPSLVFVIVLLCACAALMFFVQPAIAVIMLLGDLACLGALYLFARTQFGGMSGDLAGAFLQVAELVMFTCLVISWMVVF